MSVVGGSHQDAQAGALDAADHLTVDDHPGTVDALDDDPHALCPGLPMRPIMAPGPTPTSARAGCGRGEHGLPRPHEGRGRGLGPGSEVSSSRRHRSDGRPAGDVSGMRNSTGSASPLTSTSRLWSSRGSPQRSRSGATDPSTKTATLWRVGSCHICWGHRPAIGGEPHGVPGVGQVPAPAQHGVRPAHRDDAPDERQEVVVDVLPVEPGDLVVLAVRVVVPPLRAPELVAAEEHRDPAGQQQGHEHRPHVPVPGGLHRRVVAGALDAVVPRDVVVGPVPVVLAVGLVVLGRVGHQVAQGEAVVAGHVVDRGVRTRAGWGRRCPRTRRRGWPARGALPGRPDQNARIVSR